MGEQYANPPMIEALVEFQFTPETAWDSILPGSIYERIKPDYGKEPPGFDIQVAFDVNQQAALVGKAERHIFKHKVHNALLQLGPRLLALNLLPPYIGWAQFQPLIRAAYHASQDAIDDGMLSRITVRYINQIDIPEQGRVTDYFSLYPVFQGAPFTDYSGFVVGMQFPLADGLLRAELRSAANDAPGNAAFILDLECTTDNVRDLHVDGVLAWLDMAHDQIEALFEAALTTTTRRQFQQR